MNTKLFLWYLASPYTHTNLKIMKNRLVKVGKLAAILFKKGVHVFPVMSATASMAKYGNMKDTTWNSWKDLDLNYLSRCDGMLISQLDKEWYKSVGMRAEFEYCLKNKIPVFIVDNKGNIQKWVDQEFILKQWDQLLNQDEEEK